MEHRSNKFEPDCVSGLPGRGRIRRESVAAASRRALRRQQSDDTGRDVHRGFHARACVRGLGGHGPDGRRGRGDGAVVAEGIVAVRGPGRGARHAGQALPGGIRRLHGLRPGRGAARRDGLLGQPPGHGVRHGVQRLLGRGRERRGPPPPGDPPRPRREELPRARGHGPGQLHARARVPGVRHRGEEHDGVPAHRRHVCVRLRPRLRRPGS
mmetsp:Transcript_77284/g.219132  ORF Transcript_77284/g.219132 Transcript_77284/m.219132 type:complete len:211 (+) Transcript_77284:3051-3683(+)